MPAQPLPALIRYQAYRIVLWQWIGVAILALLSLLVGGISVGFSVLAGGLSYGIPNLIFVYLVFRFSSAQQMTQFLVAFYGGEVIKLVMSSFLFLMVVKTLPVSLLSTLAGFIGAIVSFWIACIWQFSRQNRLT